MSHPFMDGNKRVAFFASDVVLRCNGKMVYLTSVRTGRTRLSSRGQVVLPAWVRKQLLLREGDEMTVEIDPRDTATIVLRLERQGDVDRVLEEGARWLTGAKRDLVEELHAARRMERVRERAPRRP